MSKNIVVLSDGTGQEGGIGYNTNVYKIFNMIEDRTSDQVAFYDPGIGTGRHIIGGNIGGFGMSQNVHDCYRFIFEHYQAGDKIYLIGFSRGAATVRSLSSFIHYFGILPKSRPDLIADAYRIYRIPNREKREEKATAFINKHHTMWANVHFLGCFDTVAALGLPNDFMSALLDGLPPFKNSFHNFTLSESVQHAYQALAIDDCRKVFHPVLWNAGILPEQSMKQVWFCGMHTDVGGGYRESGLSDIPLVWMVNHAVHHGLKIYPGHDIYIEEDADGFMHDSRKTVLKKKLFTKKQRFWPADRSDIPVIHESVLQRKRNEHNKDSPPYHPWILDLEYEVEPWVSYRPADW